MFRGYEYGARHSREQRGAGRLKQSFDALSEDFSAPLVFDVEHEYYYKGETLNCRFELIYEGIGGTPAEPEVSQNDIIGNALGERVSLCARSKELDPYLVSCSYHPPQEKDGYWYYFPGMYISTEMKFLSFQPADYGAFKSMYDHATTGEEALGMTLFNWWSLVENELDEYSRTGRADYPLRGYTPSSGVSERISRISSR